MTLFLLKAFIRSASDLLLVRSLQLLTSKSLN